jgi:hypothetical protein
VPSGIRRGVEVSDHELAELIRALTIEQRYALIDAGWGDDVAAAVDFAVRHSADVRQAWEALRAPFPRGHEGEARWRFVLFAFWDRAVPMLVANPREHPEPKARNQGRREPAPRSRRPKEKTYGHPDTKYPTRTVADAVRRWREGGKNRNVSEISRRTGLSRQVLERIGQLDQAGAFELGPRGGLRLPGTDRKFRAAGALVSIRALERALALPPTA